MSSTSINKDSIVISLLVSTFTLFVGTVVFNGMLESFKDDMSSRKDIVTTYYRPLQTEQNECLTLHTKLMEQRGNVAGSYRMMSDEFNHLASGTARMTGDYQVWLETILTNNANAYKQVEELLEKVKTCKEKVLQQYEEMALITGTYKKYDRMLKDRNERYATIGKDAQVEREKIQGLPKDLDDLNKIIGFMRQLLQGAFDAPEDKKAVATKITTMAEPMIAFQTSLINEDAKALNADRELANKLHEIFTEEINSRYTRNFISRLLF
jgi:hypothetical protein